MLQGTETARLMNYRIMSLITACQGLPLLLWKRDIANDQKLLSDHTLSPHIISHMFCDLYNHISVLNPALQQKMKGSGVVYYGGHRAEM